MVLVRDGKASYAVGPANARGELCTCLPESQAQAAEVSERFAGVDIPAERSGSNREHGCQSR